MPKVMSITRPLSYTVGGSFPNVARVMSPNPREAAVTPGGTTETIDVDLGSVQLIDTLFVGFVTTTGAITVTYGTGGYNTFGWLGSPIAAAASDLLAEDLPGSRHFVSVLDTPVSARFIRLTVPVDGGQSIGVVVVGKAFRPTFGHEFGAGRSIEDTGSADRLFGGGFGINEGARIGGYQWTLGDLSDAEVRTLYALARNRGSSRSVLVVEDPEISVGLNERCHWGLLAPPEAYERFAPGLTRWGLKIRDWA